MTPELIIAAVRMADIITQENAALAVLDLARAASAVAEKSDAADALTAALALAERMREGNPVRVSLPGWDHDRLEGLNARLRDLAQDNKRLLERALAVQQRVIGTLVQAATPANPRYGATGGLANPRPGAVALSARA